MLICIYATMREILAGYLKDNWGFSVNKVLPGGYQDENSLWVCSARQTRGGTRPITVTVFVRRNSWDVDYEAHSLDKGKINVCVSRATEEQIIIAEHWDRRPWDALHRMMHHAWQHRNDDGYEYHELNDYYDGGVLECPAYNDRKEQAKDWCQKAGWENHIEYDSDDEDPSAVEFFANTDRLWAEYKVTRDRQTRSWDIPRYEAVSEVSEDLWDHVKFLVAAVTVRADFDEETQEDSEDEGAWA